MSKGNVVAQIDMMVLPSRSPGVSLAAERAFGDLSPAQRCILLAAAIQLCAAAISAICEDYPEDRDEIEEHMKALSIEPSLSSLN